MKAVQDVLLIALIYNYAKTSFAHIALATGVYFGGLGILLSGTSTYCGKAFNGSCHLKSTHSSSHRGDCFCLCKVGNVYLV